MTSAHLVLAAGGAGQALFFLRSLVQWVASERAGRSVVPRAFWWLSVAGAALLAVYAGLRRDPVFLLGALVNLGIFARNLTLSRRPRGAGVCAPVLVAGALLVAGLFALQTGRGAFDALPWPWLAVGVVGQAVWTSRHLVQWWLSERAGESLLPPAYWWISLAGSALLLAYAARRLDPVFVLAYGLGPIPYARNLVLGARGASDAPRRARRASPRERALSGQG